MEMPPIKWMLCEGGWSTDTETWAGRRLIHAVTVQGTYMCEPSVGGGVDVTGKANVEDICPVCALRYFSAICTLLGHEEEEKV